MQIRWKCTYFHEISRFHENVWILCKLESTGYTVQKAGHMVLKAVTWVHSNKIHHMVWKESFGYTMQKWSHMVLKGFNWVHIDKIRSNGLESSQLGSE